MTSCFLSVVYLWGWVFSKLLSSTVSLTCENSHIPLRWWPLVPPSCPTNQIVPILSTLAVGCVVTAVWEPVSSELSVKWIIKNIRNALRFTPFVFYIINSAKSDVIKVLVLSRWQLKPKDSSFTFEELKLKIKKLLMLPWFKLLMENTWIFFF